MLGMTSVEGNEYPVTALPAGYATNVIIGGLLIFAGFNTLASKVFVSPSHVPKVVTD